MFKSVAILGESGVTGQAVARVCKDLSISIVSPEFADVVVASPGIPPSNYPEVGPPPISEIEFSFLLLKSKKPTIKLIGVTGTNGKSTVTSMIGHLLGCPVSGNIGIPLINFVLGPDLPDYIVVELSSYQLERCFVFCPDISILLNITPDHLERHGSMDAYAKSKATIYKNQCKDQFLIYNEDDDRVIQLLGDVSVKAKVVPFSRKHRLMAKVESFQLGIHNALNAVAALLVIEVLGKSVDDGVEKLKHFSALPHRLEFVKQVNDVSIYNDSKSTNLDSTQIAICSFKNPVHLIMGGKLKLYSDSDYRRFQHYLKQHVCSLVVFGESASTLVEHYNTIVLLQVVSTMKDALDISLKMSEPGDTLVFSPGYSSFDQFDNFEHRGTTFKEMVNAL
ncbi:UDP-N-acetylmuramoyl-L-alanine--D-glutamate ligase [bacterium]|jgi:UDP-N-acetylmuramoylalanine--D-glutamate ligase|nr:UDP-N-acetylmuramoyl-L-alanine--D-glutamate ligase [Candidatus Falkowbacteria bacterium]MBT5954540.1 UDP-N-acetylmuramoyl-L-alanine--D-glutamate ligase [bacterium]